MTTTAKPNDTQNQLRALMSQHTATASAKSPPPSSRPAAIKPAPFPELGHERPGQRYSVRLSPAEIERLDSIALETHQRLGQRVNATDIFRIGLHRLGANNPITADELSELRQKDRRRQSRFAAANKDL